MDRKLIRLCYRKVIDNAASVAWDKMVHEASWKEFRMQGQLFAGDKKYNRFSEMIANNPRAEQLHFLTSASITGYIRQLNELMPDIADNLGNRNITFTSFRFEIINSNLNDLKEHTVAINFYSEPLVWVETIHQYLLVHPANEQSSTSDDGKLTQLIELRPYLSIYSLKMIE